MNFCPGLWWWFWPRYLAAAAAAMTAIARLPTHSSFTIWASTPVVAAASAGARWTSQGDETRPHGLVGPVTGELGDGYSLVYLLEFTRGSSRVSPARSICTPAIKRTNRRAAVCVLVFAKDANGDIAKVYFQTAGSVTLTEDPLTISASSARSPVELEEVTINPQSAVSTPVPGGKCATLPDNNVNHDRVPNAWTCAHADYGTTTTCNCVCGTRIRTAGSTPRR